MNDQHSELDLPYPVLVSNTWYIKAERQKVFWVSDRKCGANLVSFWISRTHTDSQAFLHDLQYGKCVFSACWNKILFEKLHLLKKYIPRATQKILVLQTNFELIWSSKIRVHSLAFSCRQMYGKMSYHHGH